MEAAGGAMACPLSPEFLMLRREGRRLPGFALRGSRPQAGTCLACQPLLPLVVSWVGHSRARYKVGV